MYNRLKSAQSQYPRQFWLLFYGMIVSTIGSSMIWPFLMIYASERLNQPLTAISSIFTINSAAGIAFSLMAGPVVDRIGRKWVMVISLLVNGVVYVGLSQANTLLAFGLLYAINGAINPLYRVGADAMMADLIEPDKRIEAYSYLRLANNIGVAIGPAVGGFITSTSYATAFYIAAVSLVFYGLLVAFFAYETLPKLAGQPEKGQPGLSGYGRVLRDGKFLAFTFNFTLTTISVALVWVLLSVYAKHQFHVPESQYGWLPTTNALMVVFLQLWITRRTKMINPLLTMAGGALLYAISVGSVAFMQGFWGFWVSMVVLTFGEMLLAPNSNTYAANLAPADMRGRYMSIYGLTWPVAMGVGPVMGSWLSDTYGPAFTWYGGFVIGIVSLGGYLLLYWLANRRASRLQPEDASLEQN